MRGTGFLILALVALVLAPLGEGLRHRAAASGWPAGWMELCAEAGPTMVTMAADGSLAPISPDEPAGQPDAPLTRHCPDCLPLPLPVTAAGAAPIPQRIAVAGRPLDCPAPRALPAGHDRPRLSARSPPMVI